MASSFLAAFPVPSGFTTILDKFIKAILRDQPQNIIEYSAKYFENLEEGGNYSYQSNSIKIENNKNTREKQSNISIQIHQFYDIYFKSQKVTHTKEEIISFIRNFAVEYNILQEPYPNNIQSLTQFLDFQQSFSKQQFLEIVKKCFGFQH